MFIAMVPAIDVDFMKFGGNDRVLTSVSAKRRKEDRQLFLHWPGPIGKCTGEVKY